MTTRPDPRLDLQPEDQGPPWPGRWAYGCLFTLGLWALGIGMLWGFVLLLWS